MSGVNKVIIVGNLGNDPEIKTVGQGGTVARFSVATSESWVGKDGQKQDRTEWHRIVVWGKQAENCAKFLSKGRQVYVEGKLQTRSWDDATTGQKKYSTEIVAQTVQFLSSGAGASAGGGSYNRNNANAGGGGGEEMTQDFGPEPSFGNDSDDIPF